MRRNGDPPLRRNPDIRWSSSQKKLRPLAGVQLRLLEGAAGALKPFADDVKDNVFTLRMQYKF